MAKAVKAGQAYVELGVRNNIDRGLKAAQKQLRTFGRGVTRAGAAITGAGAAALTPLVGAAASFASAGDNLDKMAIRTGIAVESLSGLAFAAEQSGTSIDSLSQAMFRANRRIGNATTGTGPAVRALEELGLAAGALAELTPEQQFLQLVDSLNQVENQARRNQLAFEIFGDNFRQIQPLLAAGRQGIAELTKEAEMLGRVMTTEDATAAAKLTDSMNRVKSAVTGVTNQIGAALAPTLIDLSDRLAAAIAGVVAFVKENRDMIVMAAKMAAVVSGVGFALTTLGGLALVATTVIGGLATAIGLLLNPITLVVGGLAALTIAVIKYTKTAGMAVEWLAERFGPLVKTVKNAVAAILSALTKGDFSQAFELIVDTMEMIWLDLTEEMYSAWQWALGGIINGLTTAAKMVGMAFRIMARMINEALIGSLKQAQNVFSVLAEGAKRIPGLGALAAGFTTAAGVASGGAMGAEQRGNRLSDMLDRLGKMTIAGAEAFQQGADDELAARKKARDDRLKDLREGLNAEGKLAREEFGEFMKGIKMPETPDLPQFEEQAKQTARGTFSAMQAALMGGSVRNPNERTARGVEKLVGLQKENNDLAKNQQARFGF